ncbi:hypothetical protein HA402_000161 [Bradysia odoriphaga]|nr:hypothetical protein HA402_000161 [Bradysia odoriphaga]
MMNRLRCVRFKDYRNVYAKHLSTESTANRFQLAQLKNRSLIRLHGDLVSDFLQSLITNDINHLSQQPAIFSMFLNKAGRVLYDTIIYKTKEKTLLVECDVRADVDLVKHLKMFRVRKKIDIDVASDLTVWVAFDPHGAKKDIPTDKLVNFQELSNSDDDLIICNDPRVQSLGVRIVAPKDSDILQRLSPQNVLQGNPKDYKIHRYKLGVAEGVDELPHTKCFPLESNCDYLHGVSFHKGCYLGQEFTARTHHTGVIRKRLMPLQLVGQLTDFCSNQIETTDGAVVGKLRGHQQDWGLGLLKVDVALQETSPFILGGSDVYVKGTTYKPFWWPTEAPKLTELKNKEL